MGAALREAAATAIAGGPRATPAGPGREQKAVPRTDEPRVLATPFLVPAPAEARPAPANAPLPPEARPVAPLVLADPTLGLLVGQAHARMVVDAGDAGSLQLHLSLEGDVARLEARGPAAAVLEGHAGGLRAALAGEGLHLQAVTLPEGGPALAGGDRGGSSRREPPPDPPAPHAPPPPHRERSSHRAGRVHVQA